MDGSGINFPPLPTLQGETLLEVFTHKSLGRLANINDNERYALLGSKAFDLVLTHCVFKHHSQFKSKEIEEEVKKISSDENFLAWASAYKLREKLRYNPQSKDEIFTPEGAREVFLAYIGGVYNQPNGHGLVESWVMKSFFPTVAKSPEYSNGNASDVSHESQFNGFDTIHQSRSGNASPPLLPTHKPRPPPPPEPFYSPEPRSVYSSPFIRDIPPHMVDSFSRPTVAVLPKFNEITTRRRMDVQWLSEQTGMQHAPLWKIECVVNNHVCGTGTGTTKQLAKEEAAKEAFLALRLDTYGKY